MAIVDKDPPVTLQELTASSFATADALVKLLIKKGLITQEEFLENLSTERGNYQALLGRTTAEVHPDASPKPPAKGTSSLTEQVEAYERKLITEALRKTGFNQTKAASLLGITRRILKYRMTKLGISESGLSDEDEGQ